MAENLDCLIIGGGPAGLTAAIYLARFHLKIIVADDGNSRALQIPLTRNHAGFPKGISGTDLLRRMRVQALKYGVGFIDTHIDRLQAADDGFQAEVGASLVSARSVLLARRPAIPEDLHANALRRGQLRYCPVCDGYEVTDQDVAVIGRDARALSECIFLRSFTDRVTLVLDDRSELTDLDLDRVRTIGVTIVGGRPKDFVLDPSRIHFWVGEHFMTFDAIYPALGSEVHSELAASAGATLTEEGCVKVDAHQRTDVSGLYAAGDVVVGLDQISHAMGEAGVAATTIRNDLASAMPILR